MTGSLVISLDFELYWGVHDKRAVASYEPNLSGTREAVARTLELFESRQIAATWATVGALFAKDREHALAASPTTRTSYTDGGLSPWHLIDEYAVDPVHLFAPEWVSRIAETPLQEVATHTFSHTYFLEDGCDKAAKRADLAAAHAVARAMNVQLQSIVFPRNQYDADTLEVCADAGLECYRGNPESMLYRPRPDSQQTLPIRALRLIDSYIPLTRMSPETTRAGRLVNVPATRFLRPYSKRLASLERLRIDRLITEMTANIRRGEMFHLWWHPHNFGQNTDENLQALDRIIDAFVQLRETQGAASRTMIEEARARTLNG